MDEKYYNKKFVESIIYDPKLKEKLEKRVLDNLLNIEFLIHLNSYLDLDENQQCIDDTLKNKIYELVRYIRFNLEKNKEVLHNIILNQIIKKLNHMHQNNFLGFYYKQANARAHDSEKMSFEKKVEKLFELYEDICKSISYDFQVLCDLYKTPEEYKKIFPKYVADGWFISSIKGIYYKKKKIFRDPYVLENLTRVVTQNETITNLKQTFQESNYDIKRKILKR